MLALWVGVTRIRNPGGPGGLLLPLDQPTTGLGDTFENHLTIIAINWSNHRNHLSKIET